MEPSFAKLLDLLAEASIDFIVVGGLAVSIQGYVRLTDDVDLLIDGSPENIERLLIRLSDYGEGFARQLSIDDFTDDEGAIRIVEEAEQCQIDLFTRIAGRYYKDVIADAHYLTTKGGYRIAVASKASLIGWKSKSVREKDQFDAMALRRLEEDPRAFD